MCEHRTYLLSNFVGLSLVLSIITLGIFSSVLTQQEFLRPTVDRVLACICTIWGFRWFFFMFIRMCFYFDKRYPSKNAPMRERNGVTGVLTKNIATLRVCTKQTFTTSIICIVIYCIAVILHCYRTSLTTGFDLTGSHMILLAGTLGLYHIHMIAIFFSIRKIPIVKQGDNFKVNSKD